MSKNIPLTIPDEHYNWLEEVRKRRGWEKIQEAIRSVIEDAFRADKKRKAGTGGANVSIIDPDLEGVKNVKQENCSQPA